ncbi:AsmA-like C-terminal region-containing protein [Methyloversatilis discipulorum]|uniref:AsmA-like C-terminal region-containing protein n=1 Tax=Methyloversatilis discipulorum TaxID=1119528 RepID=UPI003137DB16
MNENAVYVKTEAGEEAVSKRTIVQRNLRSILIMIDGRTPVGNLAQQFGDPLIVEGLVGELEHRGLVRRIDAPTQGEEADRAELSSMLVDIEDLVSQPITPVSDDIRRAHEKASAKESPVLDEFAMALPELAAPAPANSPAPAAALSAADDVRGAIRRAMMSASPDAAASSAERSGGGLQRLFDLFAGRVGDRKGPPGSLGKKIVLSAAVLLVLLVGLFFLYPYQRHLPHFESLATELLGQPVRIASVSPSLFPEPSIALEGVTVGGPGQLEIGAVKLLPRVSTLLSERTVLRDVRIERAALNLSFLPALSRRQDINWASRWVTVEHVSMVDASIVLLDGAIGALGGDLALDENGVLTRLSLASADGGLKLQGNNAGGVWSVSMTALGWQTPGKPSLLFDVLEAQGTLNSRRLQFDKLDVKLYDGYATGSVALDFADVARFEGQLQTSRLSLGGLLKVFAPTLLLTGDLSLSLSLTGEGRNYEELQKNLRGTGTMGVQRGQIERVDLVQAVRIPRPGGVRGGSTRFDRLDANAVVDASGVSLSQVVMESGLVGANGTLRLADDTLRGRLDVTLQGSATTVRAPVSIEGPYADPVVKLLR